MLRDHQTVDSGKARAVAIALVPIEFSGNWFSVCWEGAAVVSTYGWDEREEYEPYSVYEYLIRELAITSVISATIADWKSVSYHSLNITKLCVFDSLYIDGRERITEVLAYPQICPDHYSAIRRAFSDDFLAEFERFIGRSWLYEEPLQTELLNRYSIRFRSQSPLRAPPE
jgi:hypothetical protein